MMRLALNWLSREWTSGSVRILFFGIVIAIAAHTSIGFVTDRLFRTMTEQAADVMGGTLIWQSSRPMPQNWQTSLQQLSSGQARAVEFATVVYAGEAQLLVSGKSVSDNYPLRGELRTLDRETFDEQVQARGPEVGKAWVEARVMEELDIRVGEFIELGSTRLQVERVLSYEPDRAGGFYSMTPRVLFNVADLSQADVLTEGSRAVYKHYYLADEKQIRAIRKELTPKLSPSDRLLDVNSSRPTVSNALRRAEVYLSLSSSLAVLLAGVAIAIATRSYTLRHFDTVALLKTFGRTRNEILQQFFTIALVLGIAGTLAGGLIGWLAHHFVLQALGDLVPASLPASRPGTVIQAFGITMIALLGVMLPPILRLGRVPPSRVLRRELSAEPEHVLRNAAIAMLCVLILMYTYTNKFALSLSLTVGISAAILIAMFFSRFIIKRFSQRLTKGPMALRIALKSLGTQSNASATQLLAFALAGTAFAVAFVVKDDLLVTWKNQLPTTAPNYFALNIQPQEAERFKRQLTQAGIEVSQLYPIVRGRLTEINGAKVTQAVSKEDTTPNALRRDLNLTMAATMQPENALLRGQWWPNVAPEVEGISVESQLARRLGVDLGDTLRFTIGTQDIETTVTSIRDVKWDSFNPNFYIIFKPGALDNFPVTYLTSFYVPTEKRKAVLKEVRSFPAVTLLDVDQILNQIRDILNKVTGAIELVFLFVITAAILILFATLHATRQSRNHQLALLRTFGMNDQFLKRMQTWEFLLLGLGAGLLAAGTTEVIKFLVYRWVLKIDFAASAELWIALPVFGMLCIQLLGRIILRSTLKQPATLLLRESK